MRLLARILATFAILALGAQAGARVYTGGEDLDKVWQRYLDEQAHSEPGIEFPYAHCFRRAALVNDLPETLLIALARGESDFDARARSHANAHGLMQILWPTTANHLGFRYLSELYEPCRNVDAGARYLKELMQRYDNNLHLSLAAYNYGPHRISPLRDIPDGAEWYSGYIYRHMKYVLSKTATTTPDGKPRGYFDEGKTELIVFREPYRAAAFVASLERQAKDVRFDWFRSGQARYRVVMLYDGEDEFRRARARLALAGFEIE